MSSERFLLLCTTGSDDISLLLGAIRAPKYAKKCEKYYFSDDTPLLLGGLRALKYSKSDKLLGTKSETYLFNKETQLLNKETHLLNKESRFRISLSSPGGNVLSQGNLESGKDRIGKDRKKDD